MVKNETRKGGYQGNRNSGNQGWKPPTSELTDVRFDYGTRMKTGDFKRSVSQLAGVVAMGLKHGIKDVVKACNTGEVPIFVQPADPATDATPTVHAAFKYKIDKYFKQVAQWEENNNRIYNRFHLHSSPSMETKLESMPDFETVKLEQDGIGLIKLLRKTFFEQDGTKQAMLEIVEADKRLMLCW